MFTPHFERDELWNLRREIKYRYSLTPVLVFIGLTPIHPPLSPLLMSHVASTFLLITFHIGCVLLLSLMTPVVFRFIGPLLFFFLFFFARHEHRSWWFFLIASCSHKAVEIKYTVYITDTFFSIFPSLLPQHKGMWWFCLFWQELARGINSTHFDKYYFSESLFFSLFKLSMKYE